MFLDPSLLHVELSSKCVLKCPRCPRTELNLDYLNQEIDLDTFKKTFTGDVLNLIKRMVFCGHTGDPIYATEFVPIVRHIKSVSSTAVTVITNGSYRKSEFWTELGSLLDCNDLVVFSVDGWDQSSNNLYRVNSDFDSIIDGIKTLRKNSQCLIQWSTIYFRFNQDRTGYIREIARQQGCDFFELVRSSKFDGRYAINGVDPLKPQDQFTAQTLIYDKNIELLSGRQWPALPLTAKNRHPWARCLNGNKEPYLDVTGRLLPCVWFSESYHFNDFLNKYYQRLNVRTRSFVEILEDLEVWHELETAWTRDPPLICQLKCKNGQQQNIL